MAKEILIRPLVTEKAEVLENKNTQYSFVVNKKANKVEIKKAVESEFNVQVVSVNTLIIPAKTKNRNTRAGLITGRKSAFKKAIITLAPGEEIDYFGDI